MAGSSPECPQRFVIDGIFLLTLTKLSHLSLVQSVYTIVGRKLDCLHTTFHKTLSIVPSTQGGICWSYKLPTFIYQQ